jgi:hypothetical protein
MDLIPLCVHCIKPDWEDRTCLAYPKGIPTRILHGKDCDYFKQNPEAPPPPGGAPEPKKPQKTAI